MSPLRTQKETVSKHQRGNKEFKKPKKLPATAPPMPSEVAQLVHADARAPRNKK
jgi:hypothetical protein